jgi:hypothetical protein
VESSIKIQTAARIVANENRKLRELLRKRGISDEYIENFLRHETTSSTNSQDTTGQAVKELENLLRPRQPAFLDPSVPFPTLKTTSVADSPWHTLSEDNKRLEKTSDITSPIRQNPKSDGGSILEHENLQLLGPTLPSPHGGFSPPELPKLPDFGSITTPSKYTRTTPPEWTEKSLSHTRIH